MRKLIPLLLVLSSACVTSPHEDPPSLDATPVVVDSNPVDATPPPDVEPARLTGCNAMAFIDPPGLTDGDTLPPNLINNMVDAINGNFVEAFDETFFPINGGFNAATGAGATFVGPVVITDGAGSSVPGYSSTGINRGASIVLPYHVGYRLTGAKVMVCGNGVVQGTAAIYAGPTYQSVMTLGGSTTQRGLALDIAGAATWRTLTLTHAAGVLPFDAWDTSGGPAMMFLDATGAGWSFGPVTLTWDRLP